MQRGLKVFGIFSLFACFAAPAAAQDLKAKLVVEMDRMENDIKDRRWNLSTLADKRAMEKELGLLKRLYERVVIHESDIATFECNGSTIDPDGGPPVSSKSDDDVGTLSMGSRAAEVGVTPPAPAAGGGTTVSEDGVVVGSTTYRFSFIRQITDTEVQLLAQIVAIEDRLQNDDWHLNNREEKRNLEKERDKLMSGLRRVRNSRC